VRAKGIPAVSVSQMREIDRLMVEEIGITLEQMMENAGRALAQLARRWLRELAGRRIDVLVGPGGNGGGALVAARRLANWGAEVHISLAVPLTRLHGVPARQAAIAQRMGLEMLGVEAAPPDLSRGSLILDGLLGYSLDGAPRGRSAELIVAANTSQVPILALDVPSGLSADSGEPFAPTIRARQTLALALPKAGLLQPSAQPYVGELFVADISVAPSLYERVGVSLGAVFATEDVVRFELS
jgi:NAD(P)H-hydrate epimerase